MKIVNLQNFFIQSTITRHWVNWLFEEKMQLELINLELKFVTKQLNPQIYLPFNFLIQKFFFNDNPTWNINYSE